MLPYLQTKLEIVTFRTSKANILNEVNATNAFLVEEQQI